MENIQLSPHNSFVFDYPDQNNPSQSSKITFSSVFDSGNLRQVTSLSPDIYVLYTAPDCYGTTYEGNQKSWFYFSVKGVPNGIALDFTIKKISILASLYKSAPETYKPVYKVNDGKWKRIEEKAVLIEDPVEKTLDVKFSHVFLSPNDEVFFAFSYPFSYRESQQLLAQYNELYTNDRDIYYHHEVIIKSPQDRAIDLLTISSHEGKLGEKESMIDNNLFSSYPRAQKFRTNKPVILITARVHPGETPASHTMNGLLKFLLDKKDIRARTLRNYFVFMMMPMINPDGVANGHYRMDIYNQNLNRYYRNPDLKKQPSIYAVKRVIEYLNSEERLFFYCDLHAHAAKKGCFLYGNALDFVKQVESMLYSKVIGLNCVNFESNSCNFSEKHMKARDKGEKLTKEGAARVCVYKICDLIHSYTLECGLHYSNELNTIAVPSSSSTKEWYEDKISDINSTMYKDSPTYYSIDTYEDLGKAMLVSVLDTFEKNPCSRLAYGALETLRKEIAAKIIKNPRFRKEANVKKKYSKINEAIKELFYDEFDRKNVFNNILPINYSQLATPKKKTLTPMSQIPSTTRSLKKTAIKQNSTEKAGRTDENTQQEEENFLPPLKSQKAPGEFQLRHTIDLKIFRDEKALMLREEYFKDFFKKKKTSLPNTQRSLEKGLLITSEENNRYMRTPRRLNPIKNEEKSNASSQVHSTDAPRHSRKVSSLKPKIQRSVLEKKKTSPVIRLPELETLQTDNPIVPNPLLFVSGNKNYGLIKPTKEKLEGTQTFKKLKQIC